MLVFFQSFKMQFSFYVVVVLGLVGGGLADITDLLILTSEEKALYKSYASQCYNATKTSEKEIDLHLVNPIATATNGVQCFFACFDMKMEKLAADGTFDLTPIQNKISTQNYEIAESCVNAATATDLCSKAYEIVRCFILKYQGQLTCTKEFFVESVYKLNGFSLLKGGNMY